MLVASGRSLYEALNKLGRGSWRGERLIAEAQLLHPEALGDRLVEEEAKKHSDVLRISRDLLSMTGTRDQLKALYVQNPTGTLKPLKSY